MGAYGGKRQIMENVSPLGKKISQAGTLSGNPLAMSAGLVQLQLLTNPEVYTRLEQVSQQLEEGMAANLRKLGLKYPLNRVGAMLCMFFTESPVVDYPTACRADTGRFRRFFWELLKRGIYLAPSQFECLFPSAVHSDTDVQTTLRAHFEALKAVH